MRMTRNISYGRQVAPDSCRMNIKIMKAKQSEKDYKRPPYHHDLISVCAACNREQCSSCPLRLDASEKKKTRKKRKK